LKETHHPYSALILGAKAVIFPILFEFIDYGIDEHFGDHELSDDFAMLAKIICVLVIELLYVPLLSWVNKREIQTKMKRIKNSIKELDDIKLAPYLDTVFKNQIVKKSKKLYKELLDLVPM